MKLMIAVPTLETVPVEFLESLSGLICRLKDNGVEVQLKIEAGSLIYFAREDLARYAIANRYSHVLWLDSDMVFPPDIAEKLLRGGHDIATGIAHSRRPPYESCLFEVVEPKVRRWSGPYPREAFRVAGCGMACCMTSGHVLDVVRERFGRMFFPTENFGEDIAFCWRAWQCGFDIWVEPDAEVGHIGRRIIWPSEVTK